MPRRTEMIKRVTFDTILLLLILSRAMTMPSGSENSSVKKNMAQVLPKPLLIVVIIVTKSIKYPRFKTHAFPEAAYAPGKRISLI